MMPTVAIRRLTDTHPTACLVQRAHSPVAHASCPPSRGASGQPNPLCGQHGKRWYRVEHTARRLCQRCTRWIERHTTPSAPTPLELAQALDAAATLDELNSYIREVINNRGGSIRVALPGGLLLPLHTHVSQARDRIRGYTVNLITGRRDGKAGWAQ